MCSVEDRAFCYRMEEGLGLSRTKTVAFVSEVEGEGEVGGPIGVPNELSEAVIRQIALDLRARDSTCA